jgi:hypothetical protein
MKWNTHACSQHQSCSGGRLCSHGQVAPDGHDGRSPYTFSSVFWRTMRFQQFSLFGIVFSTRRMPSQNIVSSIFHRSTIRRSREPRCGSSERWCILHLQSLLQCTYSPLRRALLERELLGRYLRQSEENFDWVPWKGMWRRVRGVHRGVDITQTCFGLRSVDVWPISI